VLIVWGMLYKLLPNHHQPFRMFTAGALSGIALWLVVSLGFGAYLSQFDRYETTYGTLGTAIVFLTWLWLSNISLLLGAEINVVLASIRQGVRTGP